MSFVPYGQGSGKQVSVQRTILFWVLMIALAIVLWQMASKSPDTKPRSAMSYSDFMSQVDQNNVATAKLLESPATAEVQGQLRTPANRFSAIVPKEVIPDLIERLRKQGVTVEVAEVKNFSAVSEILTLAPFAIIVGIWIYVSKLRQSKQGPAPQSGPGNGPLG